MTRVDPNAVSKEEQKKPAVQKKKMDDLGDSEEDVLKMLMKKGDDAETLALI